MWVRMQSYETSLWITCFATKTECKIVCISMQLCCQFYSGNDYVSMCVFPPVPERTWWIWPGSSHSCDCLLSSNSQWLGSKLGTLSSVHCCGRGGGWRKEYGGWRVEGGRGKGKREEGRRSRQRGKEEGEWKGGSRGENNRHGMPW